VGGICRLESLRACESGAEAHALQTLRAVGRPIQGSRQRLKCVRFSAAFDCAGDELLGEANDSQRNNDNSILLTIIPLTHCKAQQRFDLRLSDIL
jgi:hypothetical protein